MKRKKFIIVRIQLMLVALGFAVSVSAQNASPAHETMQRQAIVPIEDDQFSNHYYANEASWWREHLKKNEKDQTAWLNYYKAVRYTNYTEQSRYISKSRQAELDELLAKMKKAVPESFAFNYASYLNGSKSNVAFSYLDKAYAQNPHDKELWDDMLSKAVINSDKANTEKFAKQLSDNAIYNATEVSYNRNVLSSVEQNGILITNGNVDTYPVLMMQQLQSYRKDVRVICLEWLGNETYSNTVAGWLDIKKTKDITLADILTSKSTALYVALTLPPDDIKEISKNLYCTGLAMKYSKTSLDNLPVLASNWEKLFVKSNLHSNEQLNRNYLVPLVLLKDYYKQTAPHAGKQQEAANYFEQLSKGFGLTKVYNQHKD